MKSTFALWLMMPQTRGATFIYDAVITVWIPAMDEMANAFNDDN
jgi:hypothetical protein